MWPRDWSSDVCSSDLGYHVKIGIIGAMDEEIERLLQHMTNQKKEVIANCLLIQGKLHGKEVVLLKSDIGKVNAAMATTILHDRHQPSAVINTGSAGGYSEHLNIGDIVVSKDVVHHDVDATAFNYSYGQVPSMPDRFLADEQLVQQTMEALEYMNLHYEIGKIATGDSFMNDRRSVALVRNQFGDLIEF